MCRVYPILQYPVGAGAPCPSLASRTDFQSCVLPISSSCGTSECVDGLLNGRESDIDCGGSAVECSRCAMGRACRASSDCAAGSVCSTRQACVPAAPLAAAAFFVTTRFTLTGTVELSGFSGPAQAALVDAVVRELLFRGVRISPSKVVVLGVEAPSPVSAGGRRLGTVTSVDVDVAVLGSTAPFLTYVGSLLR
jgi:hypothetical protein